MGRRLAGRRRACTPGAAVPYLVGVGFRLPVSSMALVFALLVLASLLRKGQQLQDDNRLFI